MEAAEELIKWLDERLEYYNYEYRYTNSERSREIIDAKRTEAKEIFDKIQTKTDKKKNHSDSSRLCCFS